MAGLRGSVSRAGASGVLSVRAVLTVEYAEEISAMSIAPAPPAPSTLNRKRRPHKPAPSFVVGPMTYEQYAEFDRAAERKHQLIEGVAVQMPGGSPEHNLIIVAVSRALGDAVDEAKSASLVFASDQSIYISSKRVYYPDAVVTGIPPQFDERDRLRNPVVIVEVLSPSTQAFDRDKKFKAYQTLPSFRHYLLIEQTHVSVTHYAKSDNGDWIVAGIYNDRADEVTLTLDDVTVSVTVADMYRRVEFEPEPELDKTR